MDRENIMLENIMEEPGIIRGLIENRKEIARDFVNHFEKSCCIGNENFAMH